MLVLDSNVWIYIATADELPVEIYSDTLGERLYFTEEFYEGRHQTVVSVSYRQQQSDYRTSPSKNSR
jgi:predicted nucleic acid-binding protein